MSEQRVLLGSTATLVSYPRVSDGGPWLRSSPTSATVRIRTPSTALPDTGADADVDHLCAELAEDAVEGDMTLILTTQETITRGRSYLLQREDDEGERVIVVADSDTYRTTVRLLEPLPCDVAAGAELAGFAVSIDLTAAQTSDAGECLALWTATVDGREVMWSQAFRVVRRLLVSVLTPSRLLSAYPLVRTLRSSVDVSLERVIDAAWTHRVLPWLSAQGVPEEDVVAADVLEPLHAHACLLHLAEQDPQLPRDFVQGLRDEHERIKATTKSRTDWYVAAQLDDPPPRLEPSAQPLRDGFRLRR